MQITGLAALAAVFLSVSVRAAAANPGVAQLSSSPQEFFAAKSTKAPAAVAVSSSSSSSTPPTTSASTSSASSKRTAIASAACDKSDESTDMLAPKFDSRLMADLYVPIDVEPFTQDRLDALQKVPGDNQAKGIFLNFNPENVQTIAVGAAFARRPQPQSRVVYRADDY